MKLKKRPLTLLEVILAMILSMALLTGLAGIHWQMTAIGIKAENEREEQFRYQLLRHRITTLLGKVKAPEKSKDRFFFISETAPYEGVVFSYDNGNSLNKPFSNNVISRLFLHDGQLLLVTLPVPSQWTEEQPPHLMEVLADEVTEFEVDPLYDESEKGLPAILTLRMKINGKPFEQRVVLPLHPKVVVL